MKNINVCCRTYYNYFNNIYNMYKRKYKKYKRKYMNLKYIIYINDRYNYPETLSETYSRLKPHNIINYIIEIIKHLSGYIKIFDEEFHVKIFRECHTHWIKLLKRIIYEQTNNKIYLLLKLKNELLSAIS